MFHTVNEINHVESPFINQLRLVGRQGGSTGSSRCLTPSSCGKRGAVPGSEWAGEVSKSRWAPIPAGCQGAPLSSRVLPSLCWLGLPGPLCRRQIVCCCFSIWLESRLSCAVLFVARLPPVSHPFCSASWQGDVLSCALRSPFPTWDLSPPVLEILPPGAFCSEK